MSRINRTAISTAAICAATLLGACTAESSSGTGQGDGEARVGTEDELSSIEDVCPEEEVTVGMPDLLANNSWRKIARAELEDEASRCDGVSIVYTDAQGNQSKQISDVNSMIARDVDAIVFSDTGPSMLASVRKATQAGVVAVPHIDDPGGVAGRDYVAYVHEDVHAMGTDLGNWVVDTLGGKGNVVVLGGLPGKTYSQGVFDGVKEVLADQPDMKLVNPDGYLVTNWDPSEAQKVMAGVLAKNPDIDAVVADYGGVAVGAINAFERAGVSIPPVASQDINQLSCLWSDRHEANPSFELATVSARTWMARVALRHALAAVQDEENPEPTTIRVPIVEDSVAGGELAPKCDEGLPPDAILSSQLPKDKLTALFD